jgi:hypothetical protein
VRLKARPRTIVTPAAVSAAALSQYGPAWTLYNTATRVELVPQLVAELMAAFRADAGNIRAAVRSGGPYTPTDSAVLAAVRTASSIRQAWPGFDDGLKAQMMAGFRSEIAAAAAAQYNLPIEGTR